MFRHARRKSTSFSVDLSRTFRQFLLDFSDVPSMTWVPNTQQDKILIGLRNGTFRTFSCSDKKFDGSLKTGLDNPARPDSMVGIASYDESILTAAESGRLKGTTWI